ncbi:hypothetical protein CALVIDRAFT_539902 [Calocera viscosa TUFC12733]|uniref:Low temperature requirement protein A n=1 Tax=Calocera viscosa (strain TUFC12733) TaxID=1330018 RepID=A0A167JCI9_CALVF|nr:hypothetical protein CALVIDRAFT_539902 [Calocera viscosa TUFC12733]
MGSVLHSEEGSKLESGHPSPGIENEVDGEEVEYLNVAGPLLPLVVQQGPQQGEEKGEVFWLAKWQRAPEYLNLLYDLAISSVLSVFGNTHEILNGPSIIAYFSYFIIIWWVWASQVVYDCRFQSNDWMHRLFKFLELGAFTYIGVFAQLFDPAVIVAPADLSTPAEVAQYESANAWKGAAIAYALSRLLLAAQYLYVACITKSKNRREKWGSFVVPIVTCIFSAVLWLISGLLSSSAPAKLVLGYGALVLEIIITVGASIRTSTIAPSYLMLGERFADLTVVILAEGVMGIVQTLAAVVSGFGLNAGESKLNGYSECISSLVTVFGTWHFIFHAFDPEQHFRNPRTSLSWAFLHLPLHFMILLLLASMTGVAVFGNIYGAVNMLTNDWLQTLDITGFDPSRLGTLLSPTTVLQFNKLALDPPFTTEIVTLYNQSYVLDAYYNGSDPYAPAPTIDPFIESLIYFSNVMYVAGQSYHVSLSPLTSNLYDQLANTSSQWLDDTQVMIDLENMTNATYLEYCNSYTLDIAAPAQLFLPSAGGLVILAAILTVFRTHGIPAPEEEQAVSWSSYQLRTIGRVNAVDVYPAVAMMSRPWQIVVLIWDWTPFALHVMVGIALCLCGFLDLPANSLVNLTNPVDDLISVGWALPIVAIAFGVLMVVDCIILVLARKARGGRFMHRIHHTKEL